MNTVVLGHSEPLRTDSTRLSMSPEKCGHLSEKYLGNVDDSIVDQDAQIGYDVAIRCK